MLLISPCPKSVIEELQARVRCVSLVEQYGAGSLDVVDVDHYKGISQLIDRPVHLPRVCPSDTSITVAMKSLFVRSLSAVLLLLPLCPTLRADPDSDSTTAARASNSFAFDSLKVIKSKKGNFAFSPFSVWTALTMTSAGAAGETFDEMQTVLHHPPIGNIHQDVYQWTEQLRSAGGTGKGVQLNTASRLFLARELVTKPAFNALTKGSYRAEPDRVPFAKDATAARKYINHWIATQTADRIPDLLHPGEITGETKLVLANAIYFKAAWDRKFDPALTVNLPFTRGPGDVVQAPMMSRSGSMPTPYFEIRDFQAIRLAYSGEKTSLIVMLPAKGKAIIPSAAIYEQIRKGLTPQAVNIRLPRFTVEGRTDFATVLKSLGMKLAFSRKADFSAMTADPLLRIDAVAHQAFIKVAEAGTEAAAASAVVMVPKGIEKKEEPTKQFIADRPFYFFIVHEPTGGILFLGKVESPDKAESK